MFDRLSEDIIKKRMAGGDGDRNDRKIAFYCVHVLLRNNPLSHPVNQRLRHSAHVSPPAAVLPR